MKDEIHPEVQTELDRRIEKLKRNDLLKKGTLTKDKKIWFNLETAQMFISAFSTMDLTETLPWRDANRQVITLTYIQAKVYSKEIRDTLQIFYGLKKEVI